MSVARDVRNFVKNKPYIKESLEMGIVNLSSLSRNIQKELNIKSFQAVKASLRRILENLKKNKYNREKKVLQILKESSMTIFDGDSIVITDEEIKVKERVKVNLEKCSVILLKKNELSKIKRMIKKNENCTTIIIRSSEQIENTPGVVAFIMSLLTEQDINVIEFISCWTDTIIVVDRKDSLRTYETLANVIS